MIIKWFINTKENKKITNNINTKLNIEEVRDGKSDIDFNYLSSINSDTVGYIMIDGIDINYPVVKSNDNDFYLNHSFDKRTNKAGWIYMDYRNNSINDKNVVIYGHNMKDGSMFGRLKQLKKHNVNTINYYEGKDKYIYQVFSVYEIDSEDYYITTSFSNGEFINFLKTIKKRSMYSYDYEPKEEDNIITLSTCSYGNKRYVVHAYRTN